MTATLGLIVFLTAHLLYIWLFWQTIPTASFGWGQGMMVAYAIIYGAYLWPRVGEYRMPVLAYIFVITLMIGAAFMLPLRDYLIAFRCRHMKKLDTWVETRKSEFSQSIM